MNCVQVVSVCCSNGGVSLSCRRSLSPRKDCLVLYAVVIMHPPRRRFCLHSPHLQNTGIQRALPPSLTYPTTHFPSSNFPNQKALHYVLKNHHSNLLDIPYVPPSSHSYIFYPKLTNPISSVVRTGTGCATPCGRGRR